MLYLEAKLPPPSPGHDGLPDGCTELPAVGEPPKISPVSSRMEPVAESWRKRAFDISGAVLALLILLPLLVMIAVAIKLESPGPILFRQARTGLDGRPFSILKFRTMYVSRDGGEVRQACRGDPRVTSLGHLLRRMSLDELPQLLNVLKGDMSLVGPRPHALAHDRAWSLMTPRYMDRFRARPGLTGYAQVCGYRGEVNEHRALVGRIAADNEYIDRWSFLLDLKIVVRTIPLVFHDPAAY